MHLATMAALRFHGFVANVFHGLAAVPNTSFARKFWEATCPSILAAKDMRIFFAFKLECAVKSHVQICACALNPVCAMGLLFQLLVCT